MNIEGKIVCSAMAAVKELYGQEVAEKMVQLQKTKREFEGILTDRWRRLCCMRKQVRSCRQS